MWTGSALAKIVSRRLMPLLFDLELVIHRVGYLRVLSTAVAALGTVGVLGQILGLTWLRLTFASLLGLAFVLTSAVAFSATRTLRERIARSERLVHTYADATTPISSFTIADWHETVVVRRNGDAHIRRELRLAGTDALEGPPHFLKLNLNYYGTSLLTERDKRKVIAKAFHSNAASTTDGVRAVGTSSWTTSRRGRPRLDIYVHLGHTLNNGDIITVTWDWPGFCADLMSGRAAEDFDVRFDQDVGHAWFRAVFEGIDDQTRFDVTSHCPQPAIKRESWADTVAVQFELTAPERDRLFGFTADYRKND